MKIDSKKILLKKKEATLENFYKDKLMTYGVNPNLKNEEERDRMYCELMVLVDADAYTIGPALSSYLNRAIEYGDDNDLILSVISAWCGHDVDKISAVVTTLNQEKAHYEDISDERGATLCGMLSTRMQSRLQSLQESSRYHIKKWMISGMMSSYATLESSLNTKILIITNNINMNPSAVKDFAKVVRDIETGKPSEIINSAVELLADTTDLLFAVDVEIGRNMEKMICDVPTTLAYKFMGMDSDYKKRERLVKLFIMSIQTERKRVHERLKSGEPKFYDLFWDYIRSLDRAEEICEGALLVVSESSMDNDLYSVLLDGEDLYAEQVMDDMTGDILDFSVDFVNDDIDWNDDNVVSELEAWKIKLENLVSKYEVPASYGAITEAKKFGKIQHGVHKMTKAIQGKGGSKAKGKIPTAVKMIADDITRTIDKLNQANKEARMEMLLKNGVKAKLLRLFRKIIYIIASNAALHMLLPGGFLVGLAIKIISVIGGLALAKHIDDRDKALLIKDLELELKIVNEKIDDSRSDSDRKAKYELMRIQNKLERNLEKLKYNLD